MFQRGENAEDPGEGEETGARDAPFDSEITWETVLADGKIASGQTRQQTQDTEETQVLTSVETVDGASTDETQVFAATDETQIYGVMSEQKDSAEPTPSVVREQPAPAADPAPAFEPVLTSDPAPAFDPTPVFEEVTASDVQATAVPESAPADAEPTPAEDKVEEPYFGFEETVSLSDQSYPSSIPDGLEEPVQLVTRAQRRAESVVVEEDALVAQESAPRDAEDTQVLRRSLLVATAPATGQEDVEVKVEETVGLPPTVGAVAQTPAPDAAPSFEDAMSDKPKVTYFEESLQPELQSRALPRVLAVLLTLIFTPIAWYLIADAAARLAFAPGNPMVSGVLNLAALGELLAGIIALIILAILAAQSSLGLIITGALVIGLGVPFLVVPGLVQETGYWGVTRLEEFNTFGANVTNHFMATGFTGLFLVFGSFLLAFGIALSSVRRTGRSEERQRAIVAESNPPGLKARWARKATEKAQSK